MEQTPQPPPQGQPRDPDLVPIERLKQYPFLAKCGDIVLKKLQPLVREREYQPGELILRMGDYSDAAYYVDSGVVSVRLTPIDPAAGKAPRPPVKAANAGQYPVQRATTSPDGTIMVDLPVDLHAGEEVLLEAGEVFGELSALSRFPVSADVTAGTPVRCLLISTPALKNFVYVKSELAGFKKMIEDRYRERALTSHLRTVPLFKDLDDRAISGLKTRAELLSFGPGQLIVEQGSAADAFYFIRGGYVKAAVQTGGANAAFTYLRKGDYAGDFGLLIDEPWPFSLFALEHVEIVKLSRELIQDVLKDRPELKNELWRNVAARLKERGAVRRSPLTSRYLQMAMDTGLIHGESVLLIDLNTCTRCDDCVRGCADTHGGTPRFIREGNKFRTWSIPTACYQCTDPVCMIGCPTGAITRPLGTLEVTINKDTCIGCGTCYGEKFPRYPGCPWHNIVAVPYYSPTINPPRDIDLATKCDLCLGRTEGPACVQMCPHGSTIRISFKDLPTVTRTLSD